MISYPNITPEIFTISQFHLPLLNVDVGPLSVRWYGLMYVIGYVLAFQILKKRARLGLINISYRACENLITYMIVGMLLGARLVYALVYNWDYYSMYPSHILRVWEGGLSFHGAALGMIVASVLFARRYKLHFYVVTDTVAMCAAPGLFFGRMGNFINAELYGRATNLPWGMVFPSDPEKIPRHPSQLYQAITEGIILSLILVGLQKNAINKKSFRHGTAGAAFLMGYGLLRFITEFAREPDKQLGFVLGPFSMGQVLCFLTFVAGVGMWVHAIKTSPVIVPKPQTKEKLSLES